MHMQEPKGTRTDKLRLALVYALTCDTLPSDADHQRMVRRTCIACLRLASACIVSSWSATHQGSERLQVVVCAKVQALATAGADASALAYVRRMRRLNLTGRAAAAGDGTGPGGVSSSSSSTLAGLAGQSHLLNWADKTFGQGLTSLTKGKRHWDLWSVLYACQEAG